MMPFVQDTQTVNGRSGVSNWENVVPRMQLLTQGSDSLRRDTSVQQVLIKSQVSRKRGVLFQPCLFSCLVFLNHQGRDLS